MPSLTIFQQSEVVRKKKFPEWRTQKFGVLLDFIQKGEVQRVGERDFRIPAELILGGDAGTYDPQLGDMGRGSMPQGVVLLQSFFPMRLNFEMDKLAIKATSNPNVAIENPFLKCIAKGFQEFRLYRDKWYHGDGTARIGTAVAHSSASGVSVYTMDSITGTQWLRRGQPVTVYDSTFTTLKTTAARINALDTGALTVTLNIIVPAAAATDIFAFSGVSGASPAGPRGLAYWLNSSTSGLVAGINRATEPQVIAKFVASGGSPYITEMVMGLYDKILNDRAEVATSIMAVCSPNVRAQAYNNMMAIQQIFLDSTSAQAVDRLPPLKGRNNFMYGGVPHTVDIHCQKDRVFDMAASLWGRAVLAEEDFFQTDGVAGEKGRFIQLYGASGGPAAGTWFGLTCDENPYTIDIGAQGVVTGLPLANFHT
jgi:hypothetical protein